MKMKSSLVILLFLSMILFNKCVLPNYYDICYTNNANYDVYIQVLDNKGKHMNVNTTYPDTTISFNKTTGSIKAHLYIVVNIGTLPIEKYFNNIPSDTLSVFYFHADTISKYSWEEIRDGYKILQRYDLSIEDVVKLKNKYDVPEIPYPPDERMKDMKMYPPYGH